MFDKILYSSKLERLKNISGVVEISKQIGNDCSDQTKTALDLSGMMIHLSKSKKPTSILISKHSWRNSRTRKESLQFYI